MGGSPANVHGGGYVPNTSLGGPQQNPGLGQTQGSYAPGQTQAQGNYAQQTPNVGGAVPGGYVPPQGPYNAYIPKQAQQGPAPYGQGYQPAVQVSA
jgi:hypothetical protein